MIIRKNGGIEMNELFRKLTELQSISSTNEKVEFIKANESDLEFIKLLKFLLNDLVVTNISRKKLNKTVDRLEFKELNSLSEFIDFLSNECSGKDYDISTIQNFINDVVEVKILESIACKDIALGCGDKLFNKAVSKVNQIETIKYMGASVMDMKKIDKLISENDAYAQLKCDGLYCSTHVNNGKVSFFSRNGKQMFLGGKLKSEMESIQLNRIICGELLLKGYTSSNRSEANGIIRGLISSNEKVENGDLKESAKFEKKYGVSLEQANDLLYIVAWDCLDTFNDERLYKYRLRDLHSTIENISSVVVVEGKPINNKAELFEYFTELLSEGEEGIIVKGLNRKFTDGKPSHSIKLKLSFQCELRIKDFVSGAINSKYENTLGALYCESEDGLMKTKLSGMSDELRDVIWNAQDKYRDCVVEIECSGISKAKDSDYYSFFFPRFKDFRFDKDRANTYEEILAIQNSILNLKESANVQ